MQRVSNHVCRDFLADFQRERYSLRGGVWLEEIDRAGDALVQVEPLDDDFHAAGLDGGDVENVVQNAEQRLTGVADGFHALALARGQAGVGQDACHADDAAERSPDLVAHVGEK